VLIGGDFNSQIVTVQPINTSTRQLTRKYCPMNVLRGLNALRTLDAGSVMSIGNYDGLHIGHRAIIEHMNGLNSSGERIVVTFEPHPLTVLRPHLAPPRLSAMPAKLRMLSEQGIDRVIVLPPDDEVLNLSAEDFWKLLRDQTRPQHIVEGNAFNFGKARSGTIEQLQQWAVGTGIQIHRLSNTECILSDRSIVPVSSSVVRWLLAHGRVEDARICLGRSYEVTGKVVAGFRRGRTLGVPTANMESTDQLIPGDGVYAGHCVVDDKHFSAAINIGTAPTFTQQKHQLEVHLLNFSGDLYGQTLTIHFNHWLRDQMKFSDIYALLSQLKRDIQTIENNAVENNATAGARK
jgi:riboflavin kinase / FMN adenylyltransferase